MLPEDLSFESQTRRRPAAKAMSYSVKYDLPPNPDVRIVFEGLMWFIFHATDECQVGIHNTTQGGLFPHRHPHELRINVWTITGCNTGQRLCKLEPHRIGDPKTIAGVSIDVNNPTYPGVYVYQKDSNPFDRLDDARNDPYDWRWVLDFEKDPLYPTGIALDGRKINPSVSINHGTFYTLHRTTSKFGLLPGLSSTPIQIGRVPQFLAANIHLNDGGDVVLGIRRMLASASEFITLKKTAGTCYQIDIQNVCIKNNMRCDFDPTSSSATARNDFYLYYDTFTRPGGKPVYALKRTEYHTADPLPNDVCFEDRAKNQEHIRSNNEAPCGSVSAGGGGGG